MRIRKRILFTSLVVMALSITAIASGIGSVQQVLLGALIVAFIAVLVKGVLEGAGLGSGRLKGKDRAPSP